MLPSKFGLQISTYKDRLLKMRVSTKNLIPTKGLYEIKLEIEDKHSSLSLCSERDNIRSKICLALGLIKEMNLMKELQEIVPRNL